MGEFEFIDRLIKAQASSGQPFYQHPQALGIGDDAALMPPLAAGEQMVVATDMLVEGRHYFPDVDPQSLGHKVLAVNLSDLAAMGATPVGFTLAAGLREINVAWLEKFTQGLFDLARQYQCACVGGDTVGVPAHGPNVFSVTVLGAVQIGRALRRSDAQPGDDIWVSGDLGDAAYAVQRASADQKLNWPEPRLALGKKLLGIAHAAIDISDGLQSEVLHVMKASSPGTSNSIHQEDRNGADALPSGLQAELLWGQLPLGQVLQQAVQSGKLSMDDARCIAATGGDEYELCFTAPESARSPLQSIALELGLALTRVGRVTPAQDSQSPQLKWRDQHGMPLARHLQDKLAAQGFDHFRAGAG